MTVERAQQIIAQQGIFQHSLGTGSTTGSNSDAIKMTTGYQFDETTVKQIESELAKIEPGSNFDLTITPGTKWEELLPDEQYVLYDRYARTGTIFPQNANLGNLNNAEKNSTQALTINQLLDESLKSNSQAEANGLTALKSDNRHNEAVRVVSCIQRAKEETISTGSVQKTTDITLLDREAQDKQIKIRDIQIGAILYYYNQKGNPHPTAEEIEAIAKDPDKLAEAEYEYSKTVIDTNPEILDNKSLRENFQYRSAVQTYVEGKLDRDIAQANNMTLEEFCTNPHKETLKYNYLKSKVDNGEKLNFYEQAEYEQYKSDAEKLGGDLKGLTADNKTSSVADSIANKYLYDEENCDFTNLTAEQRDKIKAGIIAELQQLEPSQYKEYFNEIFSSLSSSRKENEQLISILRETMAELNIPEDSADTADAATNPDGTVVASDGTPSTTGKSVHDIKANADIYQALQEAAHEKGLGPQALIIAGMDSDVRSDDFDIMAINAAADRYAKEEDGNRTISNTQLGGLTKNVSQLNTSVQAHAAESFVETGSQAAIDSAPIAYTTMDEEAAKEAYKHTMESDTLTVEQKACIAKDTRDMATENGASSSFLDFLDEINNQYNLEDYFDDIPSREDRLAAHSQQQQEEDLPPSSNSSYNNSNNNSQNNYNTNNNPLTQFSQSLINTINKLTGQDSSNLFTDNTINKITDVQTATAKLDAGEPFIKVYTSCSQPVKKELVKFRLQSPEKENTINALLRNRLMSYDDLMHLNVTSGTKDKITKAAKKIGMSDASLRADIADYEKKVQEEKQVNKYNLFNLRNSG